GAGVLAGYLGYASLEDLVRAMRPRPQPPERGAALWKRIEKYIQDVDAGRSPEQPSSVPPESAPPSVPGAPKKTAMGKLSGVLIALCAGGLAPEVSGHIASHDGAARRPAIASVSPELVMRAVNDVAGAPVEVAPAAATERGALRAPAPRAAKAAHGGQS